MIKTPDNILFYDTETTGLWPYATLYRQKMNISPDRPFMFQVANLDGQAASFRGEVDPHTRAVTMKGCKSELKWLRSKVEDQKMTIVGHNMPFEHRMTTQEDYRWKWRCNIEDTQTRWRLIVCDEMTYGLKPVTKKHFDFPDDDEKALNKALTQARRLAKARGWTIATEESHGKKLHQRADYWLPELRKLVKAYGEADPIRCLILWTYSEQWLRKNKKNGGRVHEVYAWEKKLMHTLFDMERYGFTYHRKTGLDLRKYYADYQETHRKKIHAMGHGGLNLSSPPQMKKLFIDTLKYDHLWFTDAGNAKIDAEQLMMWARGSNYAADVDGDSPKDGCKLSRSILEWKASEKVLEYLDSYEMFSCKRLDGSYVLHPGWRQAGALTGRLSCSDPNMQQIASAETSRRHANIRPRQREAFGPRPGYLWYMPDYSQIEVWLFAFRSGDKGMQKALLSGNDLHLYTARSAWGHLKDFCTCGRWDTVKKQLKKNPDLVISWDAEKPLHRKDCLILFWRMRAKMVLFSRMYGGGSKALGGKIAFLMRKPLEEGLKFVKHFDKGLPGIPNYIKQVTEEVEESGVMINIFGREYHVDKRFAYKSVNYDIQGSGADILKRATVRIDHLLKKNYPLSHLCGTIHDEIVLEVHHRDHGYPLMRKVIDIMQLDSKLVPELPIKLPVALKITNTTWHEARDVKFLKRAA